MRHTRSWLLALVAALVPAGAGSQTYWVAAAAHAPGVGDSVWRTELAVLNLCSTPATVEVRLHTEDGELSDTYAIAGGSQQVFEDVVAQLTPGDASGALELRSDQGLLVSSRTYNLTAGGTFGQAIDGVTAGDGLGLGDGVFLQQLEENDAFRCNLGVLNMGADALVVEVELVDRHGTLVGTYQLEVPAGETVQDNRPFRNRFARSDILAGYAEVTVVSGSGAWVYASVVDNRTGDPRTVTAKPKPECQLDIADRLAAIDGMVVEELLTGHPDYRYFSLHFEQPVDHQDPGAGTFNQYLTLLHRSGVAPMVLETLGYMHDHEDYRSELTRLLEANQLMVEHRFFAASMPAAMDWTLLTIEQAAADHHRIVEAIRPLYSGRWLSSGASKGGMTAVYHRRFYPDEVDATVAYVAPISFGVPDERYLDFLANVGDRECREGIWAVQREALDRRAAMLPRLATWASGTGATFDRIGGQERAFESAVVELPFTFWQYAGSSYCGWVPALDASDQAIFDFVRIFTGFWYASDWFFDEFGPYFYQAAAELGYPALGEDHLADLLVTDPLNLEEGLPPAGSNPVFEPEAMLDIADWVASEGHTLLFIYGENDPYTTGAFNLGEATDSYLFTVAGGNHGADIAELAAGDRAEVYAILERWTGVTPSKGVAVGERPRRDPRRRRGTSPGSPPGDG